MNVYVLYVPSFCVKTEIHVTERPTIWGYIAIGFCYGVKNDQFVGRG